MRKQRDAKSTHVVTEHVVTEDEKRRELAQELREEALANGTNLSDEELDELVEEAVDDWFDEYGDNPKAIKNRLMNDVFGCSVCLAGCVVWFLHILHSEFCKGNGEFCMLAVLTAIYAIFVVCGLPRKLREIRQAQTDTAAAGDRTAKGGSLGSQTAKVARLDAWKHSDGTATTADSSVSPSSAFGNAGATSDSPAPAYSSSPADEAPQKLDPAPLHTTANPFFT